MAATPWVPSQRVLVCSCERHIARLIQVNLERQRRTVTCAYESEEAVKLLRNGAASNFDRVVIDAALPGGREMLTWIRSNPGTQHLWVAIMLSKPDEEATWNLGPALVDRFVVKPFNPMELLT